MLSRLGRSLSHPWVCFVLLLLGTSVVATAQVDNVFPDTGNAGIGTTTPQAPLEIQTASTEALMWDNGGARLQNASDAIVWDRCGFSLLLDADNDQTCSVFKVFRDVASSSGITPGILLSLESATSWLDLGGYLGIGTTAPSAKLHVFDELGSGPTDHLDMKFDGHVPELGLALDGDITGGWARQFKIMAQGSGTLISFGVLVTDSQLVRGFIGGNSIEDSVHNSPWMTFLPDGKVGIGLINPTSSLAVAGTVESTTGGFKFPDGTIQSTAAVSGSSAYGANGSAPSNSVYVDQFGNVGVGTVYPGAQLAVGGGMFASGDVTTSGKVVSSGGGFEFPDGTVQTSAASGNQSSLDASDGAPVNAVFVDVAGNVGIGTTVPLTTLDVRGTTTTHTLEVTGGADLSESFDLSGEEEILPGMVVSIDPSRPGGLRIARGKYDHTVAGVVSGAGGVRPGMVMGQSGTVAAGEHPIALTGRVYVYADASSGPILPGDLLTTSMVPGHAMRVAEHDRAVGSILGKAMTGLDEGRGLILVLVALQ